MKIIIDRFEGKFVIVELENKQIIHIPDEIIPPNAKEGDVISIEVDISATNNRSENIHNLMTEIWDD